ncbi:MAG: hypothetical protein P8J20_18275 [Novosphingobium sp.]|nr:hypothetical protein [Novosphingobium sp.]
MIRRRAFLLNVASATTIAVSLNPAELLAINIPVFPFITGDGDDPHYREPYIDVEEWRDAPEEIRSILGYTTQIAGEPPFAVRHLFVHGGFKGTDTKFTFYFPEAERYEGRFYQVTHQLLADERATPYNVAMTLASGGYCIQTNQGGSEIGRTAEAAASGKLDPSIGNYRANAAAAKFSRVVAQRIYSRKHRPFGYLYGGSGGAYQVMDSAQNTSGVWDGFMPYVMGDLAANPSQFFVRAHALRVLKDKWPVIIDAYEPGGSGDPYPLLNAEEKVALEEATLYGFPPRAWFNYLPKGTGPMGYVAAFVRLHDPDFIDDFWTKPGYIAPSSSAPNTRIKTTAKVVRVIPGAPAGPRSRFRVGTKLELSIVPTGDLTSADLFGLTGRGAGTSAPLGTIEGNIVSFRLGALNEIVESFKEGDTVRIDNSEYLAIQTYYRHGLPERGSTFDFAPTYDSFRNADGSPKYVQRIRGPVGMRSGSLNIEAKQGKINGKMVVVQSMMDGDALPWMASWYQGKVREQLGSAFADSFRIWYTDNAQHSSTSDQTQLTHVVNYQGVLDQALRDLSNWVENDISPADSTDHKVVKGQVELPATAAARKGIQPVVDLKVNGGNRAELAIGQSATFTAEITMPPGTGPVAAVEWDLEGTGDYSTPGELTAKAPETTVSATHSYTKPGTYFAAIRATGHRQGDAETHFARVQNLGRVRVVVV